MSGIGQIRKRWRPSIAMVVAGVCVTLVSVPLFATLAVRLTSNQFVRETEQSLIQQSAIFAELFADRFAALPGPLVGSELDDAQKRHWGSDLHPAQPVLNVRREAVKPPRPDGQPVAVPLDPRYGAIIEDLLSVARGAQQTTLSGVAYLSHDGRLLNEPGAPSLAAMEEVRTALAGGIGRALRLRGDSYELHPLASISRDTGYRVFVAYPVIVDEHVVGAIYTSRTPLNLAKFMYRERGAIVTMLAVMTIAAAVIGWMLIRLISRPVTGLRDEALAVSRGEKELAEPLPHYGFRELATLGQSVGQMAQTLTSRSREITTYTDHVTHELKSPVTAILGAAELVQDATVPEADRARLLQNITAEGQRMNALLGRLREMNRVKVMPAGQPGPLARMVPEIAGLDITVEAAADAVLPLTTEHGSVVLLHMAQNAVAHGATGLRITFDGRSLTLRDNGRGIEPEDLGQVTQPFFTTRREEGGTGMGLAICKTILNGYGATLEALPSGQGAVFQMTFRAETQRH